MSNKCSTCRGEGFDVEWAFGVGLKEGTPLSTEEAKRRCPCAYCQPAEFTTILTKALVRVVAQLDSIPRPVRPERVHDAGWSQYQYNGWLRL